MPSEGSRTRGEPTGVASGKPRKRKPKTAAQQRAKRQRRAERHASGTERSAAFDGTSGAEHAAMAGAETAFAEDSTQLLWYRLATEGPSCLADFAATPQADVTEVRSNSDMASTCGSATNQAANATDNSATDQATNARDSSATDQDASGTDQAGIATKREACATDQGSSTTDQAVTATDQAASATDPAANATDQSATEALFYPIYHKYYGPTRVTVGGGYATTKKKWHVARLVDRRYTGSGAEYRVFWLNRRRFSRRYFLRTWEPYTVLLEDGFDKEIALVDRWKSVLLAQISATAPEPPTFDVFCKTDEFGKHTLAADMSGICLFTSFKKAAELAGRPDIVTQRDIDQFMVDELAYGLDLTKGTSWKVFKVFLRRLRDAKRDFIYKAIEMDNFAVGGHRGVRELNEMDLYDGIYLVAAYNHAFVGRAIVLTVQGNSRTVYDNDDGKPVVSVDWIFFISFVRPFVVFKRK